MTLDVRVVHNAYMATKIEDLYYPSPEVIAELEAAMRRAWLTRDRIALPEERVTTSDGRQWNVWRDEAETTDHGVDQAQHYRLYIDRASGGF